MRLTRPLRALAAAFLVVTSVHAAGVGTRPGLQLWSLRDQFPKLGPAKTLDLVKAWGITEVETAGTAGLSNAEFAALLAERGLRPVAAHVGYEAMQKDPAGTLASAKEVGALYAVVPYIPHKGPFTDAEAKAAAANFNAWGAMAKAAGLKFGYHLHGFEFGASQELPGETVFDVLMKATDPELVTHEMDVLWAYHAGIDPVALLEKYPGRWSLLHLKDLKKGALRGPQGGRATNEERVAVGTGQIDWPAVLAAAERVGVVYAFIEDEGVDPLREIPASVAYLKGLGEKTEPGPWITLFDGTSLDAFRTYGSRAAPRWKIEDGTIAWTPKAGDLATRQTFSDFELELEWKVGPNANSGIMFRVDEAAGAAFRTGIEMQILDNERHKDGKLDSHRSGAAYDLFAPTVAASAPIGEWNKVRIVAKGPSLRFWLNGQEVVDTVIGSPEWNQRLAASKFAKWPHFAKPTTGFVVLQDHGDPIWFRNLRIRRL